MKTRVRKTWLKQKGLNLLDYSINTVVLFLTTSFLAPIYSLAINSSA